MPMVGGSDFVKTSIIILTYNKIDFTKLCIESIRKYTSYGSYEIIVVDNNSTDETRQWLTKQRDIISILNSENVGFPKGCNQGIEVASGDSILLLNNDVIVTENWLSNMMRCLYSDESIGAVGPVTNSCSYLQAIKVGYNSIEEMHSFAAEYNIYNPEKWEYRLKLVGFCMLIKREVIDKVGMLDEIFTPGNFEDDDLSLRILKANYRLILCKDTFIHHFGSVSFDSESKEYSELLSKNMALFNKKWGVDILHVIDIRKDITALIKEDKSKEFNVLQIECGGCGTLMDIKNEYPNSKLYGIEKHENALVNQWLDVEISFGDTESIEFDYNTHFFDYIIIADLVESYEKILNIIYKIKKYLKEDGEIILSLNKVGRDIRSFISLLPEDIYLASNEYFNYEDKEMFIVKKRKLDFLERCLDEIENKYNVDINIEKLLEFITKDEKNADIVLNKIRTYVYDKINILNILAAKCYENSLYDFVIPFLENSLIYDKQNRDTLFNLGFVLFEAGESALAQKYLENIKEKDEETLDLLEKIKCKLQLVDKVKIKFLLRRIENDIESNESKNIIADMLKSLQLNLEDLIEIVLNDIIQKDYVLNAIAVRCFELGMFDFVMPLLQKSYEINSINSDTLYNIGYFMYKLKQYELALYYLTTIRNKDDHVEKLISAVRGEINEG